MRWSDLIGASLASLRQRFFRTLLTVLGVVIGTTSVIVMVSLGVGLSDQFTGSQENNLSLRMVTVMAPPPKEAAALDASIPKAMDDVMLTTLQAMPGVEAVWPVYRVEAELKIGPYAGWAQVEGLPPEALAGMDLEFAEGGLPEAGAPLSFVIGNTLGQQFYDPITYEPADIDLMAQPMFVTFQESSIYEEMPQGEGAGGEEPSTPPKPPKKSIVPPAGLLAGGPQGWSQYSDYLYAEQTSLVKALEKAFPGKSLPGQPSTKDGKPKRGFTYSEFRVLTADTESAELLYSSLSEQQYQSYSDIEWIREAQSQAFLIQAVLGGIGFVSLLVAAIGIANTMMMSVYERTKEIGVMKVLGAALSDIRKLFLIESAAIGFFGGLMGLALSFIISAIINGVTSSGGGEYNDGGAGYTISVIPLWLMLGAVLFSTAIGTLAGLLPAYRAMRLSALEAIRT